MYVATHKFKLIILGLIAFFCVDVFTTQTQMCTHLPVIRKCNENQKLPIDVKNIRIIRAANRDFINLTLVSTTDLFKEEDHPQIRINLEKCNSKDALDTCAHILEFKSSKLCDIIYKVVGLRQFLDCCSPPVGKCPIRKGTHVCKNCVFDLSTFHPIPLPEFYWRVVTKVYSRNEMVLCLYSEGYLERVRVQNP